MSILHFQRFGINVSQTWPEANEGGTYPNDDDHNSEKPNEIDEMITDESVDADSMEPEEDDEDLCKTAAGDYCQDFIPDQRLKAQDRLIAALQAEIQNLYARLKR